MIYSSFYLKELKNNFYLNLNTQHKFDIGDNVNVFFTKEEKKEHPFLGVVIAKKFNENNRIVKIQRFADNINIFYIINLNTPALKNINYLNSKKFKRAKLYYFRSLKEKILNSLFIK